LPQGLHLLIQGHFEIAHIIDLEGRFELTFSTNPFVIEVLVDATMHLGPLGGLDVSGGFRIDRDGLVARISVSLDAGGEFGRSVGLSFQASGLLELNTASFTKTLDGHPVPPGFLLSISGSVEFLGLASANGSIMVSIRNGNFELAFNVDMNLGPFTVHAAGAAGIYTDA